MMKDLTSVMFQQIYNIADSCIAGRFAGEDALAAVGASYPITVIFMAFAVGTNLGASVVVSRLFGAKDMVRMKSAVSTAFIACAFMSFFLTFIGYFFYGITFLLLYNVCTGIFTALGDSKTPLYFLIGSSVGNIILDYYFVACVGLGVAGVAWATFIAQGISAILALTFLAVRLKRINCEGTFKWLDLVLLAQIAAIAIPSIMQQSVLSIGNMFVQEIVNRYGSAVIAGYSGAIKLNTFAINSFMALGSCLSSYTAQNLGAGKKERLSMGFRTGIRLSLIAAIPFVVLYFFASRQMMGLFLNKSSTDAINAGREFLHIVSPMYFMISIKLMTDGIIRGAGAMHYFVMATVPDLILRILVALLLTKYFGSTGIWMAWPFGWIAATVLTIIFYRRIIFGKYVIRL